MVDEESIGSSDSRGCGAKILSGEGALEQYLSRQDGKQPGVCVEICHSTCISDICIYHIFSVSFP